MDGLGQEVASGRPVVIRVLALAAEVRGQTLDRVTELSAAGIALTTPLGLTPAAFKWPRENEGQRAGGLIPDPPPRFPCPDRHARKRLLSAYQAVDGQVGRQTDQSIY